MLETLVMAMEAATRENGTFPQACLGPDGWQKENLAPTISGRVISALLACSRSFELNSTLTWDEEVLSMIPLRVLVATCQWVGTKGRLP